MQSSPREPDADESALERSFPIRAREDASPEAPRLDPDAFSRLTKRKMLGELRSLGLARGKSKSRKKQLVAFYRDWYAEQVRPAEEAEEAPAQAKDEVAKDEPAKDEVAKDEPAKDEVAKDQPAEDAPAKDQVAKVEPAKDAPEKDEVGKDQATQREAEDVEEPAADPPAEADDDFALDIAPASRNRRTSDRVSLEVDIGFRSETNFYVGFSTDISEGGIFIATIHLLPRGRSVRVAFVLPSGIRVEADGEVAWVRDPLSFDSGTGPGIGVRFKKLTKDAEEAIQRYMDLREPLFYID